MFDLYKRRNQSYRSTFNSPAGADVLNDLAKLCNAYTSTHVTGDPVQTAFNEGRRDVYNYILRILETNDELLHRMYYQGVGKEQLRAHLAQQENDIYD